MNLLFDYSFLTVAIGTILLAIASSLVGTISVLTNQSLIGDTIGHASYPGIIMSFMVFHSRNVLLLTIGAAISGYISYLLVDWLVKKGNHSRVNALSIVSAGFFGLGMVLKNYVQGNELFEDASQAGLSTYLFGQAAFIRMDDVLIIAVVSIICIIVFLLFFESFKLYLFDATLAQIAGVPVSFLNKLVTIMMISLIAIGLKVIGAILISSFLIAPAVTGLILGKHYHQTLLISLFTGVFSALLGTYISSAVSGLSTGPTIIVCMSLLSLGSFIIHPFFDKSEVE